MDLDYGRYAQAEAALVWLNLSFVRVPAVACSPAMAIGPLMDNLEHATHSSRDSDLHLKMLTTSGTGWLKAAICAHGEDPEVEGDLGASPSGRHEILVNLRAKGDASEVRKIVEEQLQCLDGRGGARSVGLLQPCRAESGTKGCNIQLLMSSCGNWRTMG